MTWINRSHSHWRSKESDFLVLDCCYKNSPPFFFQRMSKHALQVSVAGQNQQLLQDRGLLATDRFLNQAHQISQYESNLSNCILFFNNSNVHSILKNKQTLRQNPQQRQGFPQLLFSARSHLWKLEDYQNRHPPQYKTLNRNVKSILVRSWDSLGSKYYIHYIYMCMHTHINTHIYIHIYIFTHKYIHLYL